MSLNNQFSLWIYPEHSEIELESGQELIRDFTKSVFIYEKHERLYVTSEGRVSLSEAEGYYKLVAYDYDYKNISIGSKEFMEEHNVKYPYVLGGMAQGIASADMVVAAAADGFLGFFGTGGMAVSEVEKAIIEIKGRIGSNGVFGVNMISANPLKDEEMINLLLKHDVKRIEVAGAVTLTPAIVEYRLRGAYRENGRVITKNKIFAKVSREEVASLFMSPPPEKIIKLLLEKGRITGEEAELAQEIPVAEDIIAEADSGGHTDNRPALVLFQNMAILRIQMMDKYKYKHGRIRIGAAGGICSPYTVLAAFTLGADFVMTGSINQSCVEAGTCHEVKGILAQISMSDVANAPSADMFEMGSRVQVMTKGVMFHLKANKLYETFKNCASIEEIDHKTRTYLETKIFNDTLENVWNNTRQFFLNTDPEILKRAEKNPKLKMALIFRSYLGLSSKWAQRGEMDKKADFQIFCGPAMGAFNRWVKDTYLEEPANRKVTDVAKNLIYGAMYLRRLNYLKTQCSKINLDNFQVTPSRIWAEI